MSIYLCLMTALLLLLSSRTPVSAEDAWISIDKTTLDAYLRARAVKASGEAEHGVYVDATCPVCVRRVPIEEALPPGGDDFVFDAEEEDERKRPGTDVTSRGGSTTARRGPPEPPRFEICVEFEERGCQVLAARIPWSWLVADIEAVIHNHQIQLKGSLRISFSNTIMFTPFDLSMIPRFIAHPSDPERNVLELEVDGPSIPVTVLLPSLSLVETLGSVNLKPFFNTSFLLGTSDLSRFGISKAVADEVNIQIGEGVIGISGNIFYE